MAISRVGARARMGEGAPVCRHLTVYRFVGMAEAGLTGLDNPASERFRDRAAPLKRESRNDQSVVGVKPVYPLTTSDSGSPERGTS